MGKGLVKKYIKIWIQPITMTCNQYQCTQGYPGDISIWVVVNQFRFVQRHNDRYMDEIWWNKDIASGNQLWQLTIPYKWSFFGGISSTNRWFSSNTGGFLRHPNINWPVPKNMEATWDGIKIHDGKWPHLQGRNRLLWKTEQNPDAWGIGCNERPDYDKTLSPW